MTSIDHNLPPQPTPFIGRQEELADLGKLLLEPSCRLLTLTGPGGIGKTRLAIQAAEQVLESFPDGVSFVPLQPVSSIDFLIPAIAEALKLSFHSSESPRDLLLNALRQKHLLLILDNFEHLLEASELIPAMLEAAPRLKVLVTSREVLELQEEWVRPIAGLTYPEETWLGEIETYSAVQLFTERARRVQAGFSLARDRECAVRICQLVQGMPLAIELAAAWLSSLSCPQVAAEIQNSLDFLATSLRNLPERHRNLRAVFEQSWKMLSETQREVYKRLSIFQGGFERQAAQFVASADLLSLHALVDKSLLRLTPYGRYEIHAVLRQFAQEKLAERAAGYDETRRSHCDYYAAFLEQQEVELKGTGQAQALAAIEVEIDNLRVAWRAAVEEGNQAAVRRSMGGLLIYYHARAFFEEGTGVFHRAASRWEESSSPLLGDLFLHEAWFEAVIGRGPAAAYLYEQGLEFIPGDQWRPTTPMALVGLTFLNWMIPEKGWMTEKARPAFQHVLSRCEQDGDRWGEAWMLYGLGMLAHHEDNDLQECERLMQRSAERFQRHGDLWASTFPLHHLGILYERQEKYLEARSIFHETLAICRQIGDAGGIEFALGQLSSLAAHEQDYAQSWQYLMDALRLAYRIQRDLSMTFHLFGVGELLSELGHTSRSVEVFAFLYKFAPYEGVREYVQQPLDRLRAKLPPKVYESARQRGESYEFSQLVDSLANELPAADLPAPLRALPDRATSVSEEIATAPPEAISRLSILHSSEYPTQEAVLRLTEALSRRELEVLSLVAAGYSNREIARQLVVTVGTVKKHLNNIFGKLQVSNRTQAVARARELRLLS
jgi:predicted ATPase/DNA-binding CsgD family transcriptional regulator